MTSQIGMSSNACCSFVTSASWELWKAVKKAQHCTGLFKKTLR
jgi:hypothetical protein